jgi:hypothetical protein
MDYVVAMSGNDERPSSILKIALNITKLKMLLIPFEEYLVYEEKRRQNSYWNRFKRWIKNVWK